MKKVRCVKMTSIPIDDANYHSDDEMLTAGNSDLVSPKVDSLPTPPNLSTVVWGRVVSKAQAIVADPVSMSPMPGGNRNRFVVSFRNPDSPLKVQAGKSPGQYMCDRKKCRTFAGYNIFSHVLVVAMENYKPEALLKCAQSTKECSLQIILL